LGILFYSVYLLRMTMAGIFAAIFTIIAVYLSRIFIDIFVIENTPLEAYVDVFPIVFFRSAPYWIAIAVLIPLLRDWLGPKPRRINPRLLAENAKGITLADCFRIRKFNDALDRSRYGEGA